MKAVMVSLAQQFLPAVVQSAFKAESWKHWAPWEGTPRGHPERPCALDTTQPRQGDAGSPRLPHSTTGWLLSPYTHWSPNSL